MRLEDESDDNDDILGNALFNDLNYDGIEVEKFLIQFQNKMMMVIRIQKQRSQKSLRNERQRTQVLGSKVVRQENGMEGSS